MTAYKPFDLEAAKAGAKVQTRDGRPVRIKCRGEKDEHYVTAIIDEHDGVRTFALVVGGSVTESLAAYAQDGTYLVHHNPKEDLVMAPTTRTVWRVIYRDTANNAAQRDFENMNDAGNFTIRARSAMPPFFVEVSE